MHDKREFKIDLNADDPDEAIEPIDPTFKSSKQSRKAPILLIASALIAVCGLTVFFYYRLNSKIQTINTRGSAGIANLSQQLNDKLSELAVQLSTDQEATQPLLADLDTRLKALSSSVATLQTNKIDKKELATAIKKMQDDLSPLQKSVNEFDNRFSRLDQEIETLFENLKKTQTGVLNNKKDISTLDAISIDREKFESALQKEREFNQQNMAHASETLFSEIATLNQRIKNLEKKMDRKETESREPPLPQETKRPSENLSVPKPGEILEQELK